MTVTSLAAAATDDDGESPGARRRPELADRWWSRTITVAVVVAVAAAVTISVVWGWDVQRDVRVKLGAAPLVGEWAWRFGLPLLPAAVLAVVGVRWLHKIAVDWSLLRLAVAVGLYATAFTFALAASDGWNAVLAPVVHPTEYWANLPNLPSAPTLLREWDTRYLIDFSVHVKGHPPGFILLLHGLDEIGLGAPWVAGALSFLGVAVTPVAVLGTTHLVAGEEVARRAAPFLVLVPYALWMGTSADAFFTAVFAGGVWAIAGALRTPRPARRRGLAALAGALLVAALFLTYGAATALPIPAAVVVLMSRVRWAVRLETVIIACVVAAGVTGLFAAYGFWWFDGLDATQTLYWWGTAFYRPAEYFAVANVAAAAIAVGPAVVVGLAALRTRAVWVLCGAALLALSVAHASQYSKGEVERIWLLFFPWLVPAVASLRHPNRWLWIQAVGTVVLQAALISKW